MTGWGPKTPNPEPGALCEGRDALWHGDGSGFAGFVVFGVRVRFPGVQGCPKRTWTLNSLLLKDLHKEVTIRNPQGNKEPSR